MSRNLLLLLMLALLFTLFSLSRASNINDHDIERKPYIVYMGELPETKSTTPLGEEHHSLLLSAIGDEALARESKIHSYGKSINAVAARLLPNEARALMDKENVVSVFESTIRPLHTTRSWTFVGMPGANPKSPKRRPSIENDLIVGVLDTGIYMDAPSFNDKGFGPPPSRWKGSCDKSANFTGCNNKVIGARSYRLDPRDPDEGEDNPVDTDGHGSHTASIAAGRAVKDASLYGIAKGTALGGVPFARIAVYKVCWGVGCSDMDLLAAFDQAIADGVDVISASIGGPSRQFFEDVIAIGSFHALKRRIVTSCSAGNSGTFSSSVENVAPWILTVGASSIDRQFVTKVKFSNHKSATGMSIINTFSPKKKTYPLISGAQAANKTTAYGNASACEYGTLGDKVKGKIVFCLGSTRQDYTIQSLGGAGIIMSTATDFNDMAIISLIPGAVVNLRDGHFIGKYINTTKNPTAVIQRTKAVGTAAPYIASFSSRGPQLIAPSILKPDLTAPGLNILAAYTKLESISDYGVDKRFSAFNIMSGTSMSCPHASGAAAYVKSFHPDWSPSAIKSALMTTATRIMVKDPEEELAAGAGQINPTLAVHPGLIYDITPSSYIRFLCKQGYNSTAIGYIVGGKKKIRCSTIKPALGTDGLNYPSIHVNLGTSKHGFSATFYRTVTSVGFGKSVYKATVKSPPGISVKVVPDTLIFVRARQTRSFKVIVKGGDVKGGDAQNASRVESGYLEWTDARHYVRSPILVFRRLYN